MKKWNDTNRIRCIEFDNLQEQKDYISEAVRTKKWSIVKEIVPDDFYGRHTLEETMQGMDYGFPANTEIFLSNIKDVSSEDIGGENVYMDIQGFAYDMGAVVSGEPECCINFNTNGNTPVIKILIDIGFDGSVRAEYINNRSFAIVNLINTLINKKYIVDVKFLNYNIQGDMSTVVFTKCNVENLSIATIAMISSPEYFRQIIWITRDELRNKESEYGRGRTTNDNKFKELLKNENALFIPGSFINHNFTYDCQTKEKANSYITQLFNEYCEINNIAA